METIELKDALNAAVGTTDNLLFLKPDNTLCKGKIPNATNDQSGLMPADYKAMIAKTTGMKSVLVYETAGIINTSILLSISSSSGGASSLYYIDIYRPSASGSATPGVKVKVLYGADAMKIKLKNSNSTGEFKLFIEWKQYTPISSAILMNSMGSTSARKLSMTLVEESELEGSEYATFV